MRLATPENVGPETAENIRKAVTQLGEILQLDGLPEIFTISLRLGPMTIEEFPIGGMPLDGSGNDIFVGALFDQALKSYLAGKSISVSDGEWAAMTERAVRSEGPLDRQDMEDIRAKARETQGMPPGMRRKFVEFAGDMVAGKNPLDASKPDDSPGMYM